MHCLGSGPARSVLSVLAAVWVAAGCQGGGDSREKSSGKEAFSDAQSADATPQGGGAAGTSTNVTDGGAASGGSASLPNAKTLEQCTAENRAWRAVVQSGQQPSDCVETLVSWCCTRAEVNARFPTMSGVIEGYFKQFIDQEQFVLYHCSLDAAAKKHTFHMARIAGGVPSYRTVTLSDVFPVDTGNAGGNCPVITTADVLVSGGAASGTATNEGTATDTASSGDGGGATLTFDGDVQPILMARCGGGDCHATGGARPETSQFIDDEARFKAVDPAKIESGAMPPQGEPALTAGERESLLRFLAE
jgi:hypothetical protein